MNRASKSLDRCHQAGRSIEEPETSPVLVKQGGADSMKRCAVNANANLGKVSGAVVLGVTPEVESAISSVLKKTVKQSHERNQFNQRFFSSFLSFLDPSLSLPALGRSSGISILLRWIVRVFGGVYLFVGAAPSSRTIRLGPVGLSTVSYTTY